jgi:predicted permease
LTFELNLSGKYDDYTRRVAFFDQFRSRLESLPGVRAVGAVSFLPLGGGGAGMANFSVEGAPPPKELPSGESRQVAGGYFQALSIPLTRGRLFTDQEVSQTAPVVVVNETLARQFFAGQDPLGKRLQMRGRSWEIVGVVRDVKNSSLEAPSRPQIYDPRTPGQNSNDSMAVVARTSGDPRGLIGSVRAELKAIDSGVPLDKVRTMEQVIGDTELGRRFNMLLLGLFAALALVLTTIGLYGAVSYLVTQRTREIGIRMALGANRHQVLWLVLKQGMTLTAFGVAVGLVAAFALTRLLSNMLFGVAPNDPATFTAVSLLLALIAALACAIPARRAASIEPMQALRSE